MNLSKYKVVIFPDALLDLAWLEQQYPDITEEEEEICKKAIRDFLWNKCAEHLPNLEEIRYLPGEPPQADCVVFNAIKPAAITAIWLHRLSIKSKGLLSQTKMTE